VAFGYFERSFIMNRMRSVSVKPEVLEGYRVLLNRWIGMDSSIRHYSLTGLISRVLDDQLSVLSARSFPMFPDQGRETGVK
jgi:hypothetical protein